MDAEPTLTTRLLASTSIHVVGAGLNRERTAHTAVGELVGRGWRVVPVHPRDAGATVSGCPVRPMIEPGSPLEVVVFFLAPERVRDQVRRLLVQSPDPSPLVWLQPGAEDDVSIGWLQEAGWKVVHDDCLVRYAERHSLTRDAVEQPWFRQVADADGSGCSVWTVHEAGESATVPTTNLEWVGDLIDLQHSSHTVPAYIRRLRQDAEDLEACARRLAH
jgi:predicted CoA-binding protein